MKRISIIGGGPGGLMTAYLLQKMTSSPISLTLFEATERLGGKICTRRFQERPARYEAGAAELYDYSVVGDDPLKELVEELGLPIVPIGGSSVIMDQQIMANIDDVRAHLGARACEALLSFDRAAKDLISPFEYYMGGEEALRAAPPPTSRFDALLGEVGQAAARRYIETLIHSDLATEPERTSVEYGAHNYLMNDPRYMRLYCIEGGNERLTQELARRVSATVRLNHAAIEIGRGEDGKLVVAHRHQGVVREDSFDHVILALPINHLPHIRFRGERLAAAMRAHHAHYDHPAHYLRITVLFDRPSWRTKLDDAFFMLDRFGGCCVYDESAREPDAPFGVLGWLLGGQPALEMSELDDAALIEAALRSLPGTLVEGGPRFLEGRVHRWPAAVNAIPGGLVPRAQSRRHQPDPAGHPDLFVVGDYLYDSTLNGVLDSAEYVAEWLVSQMINM
ncbi:amine oxidase [Sorangium cellulosum]|uniref:Amine oxidase n=1 Tax=Sorangium cellulosum TaxID=56 RepID=A0A150PSV6_SORCE|nr:amine oxidase [Sorangium cellulosum]